MTDRAGTCRFRFARHRMLAGLGGFLLQLVGLGIIAADEKVVSSDYVVPSSSVTQDGGVMIIESEVSGVMETWPLQLSVQTGSGSYHVILTEDAEITCEGEPASHDRLVPGVRVQLEGDETKRPSSSSPGGMVARRVDLRDRGVVCK